MPNEQLSEAPSHLIFSEWVPEIPVCLPQKPNPLLKCHHLAPCPHPALPTGPAGDCAAVTASEPWLNPLSTVGSAQNLFWIPLMSSQRVTSALIFTKAIKLFVSKLNWLHLMN